MSIYHTNDGGDGDDDEWKGKEYNRPVIPF